MNESIRTNATIDRERAILVGLLLRGAPARGNHYDPLIELHALCEAAGAEVVDKLIQRRNRVCPATYVGRGKLQQLAELLKRRDANVVVFDNELSPSQIREIEKVVQCKVLDRTELILDIFASRARTASARLQVELAQLEYTAPRLRGMWTHLERIAGAGGATSVGVVGGIGTRGPGETQIEIDRRIVSRRTTLLKRKLAEIDRRKLREVRARRDHFTISLVGYTNAGKSTLMNALTGAGAFVEDKLFATLDTLTRKWDLGGGQSALLSDTVGFVRDLPHDLVASFRATLEEAIHADLLLHVVDASSDEAERQIDAVQRVLAELGCADSPTLILLNKADALPDDAPLAVLRARKPDALTVSARTGAGLSDLKQAVIDRVRHRYVRARVEADAGNGRLLAYVNKYGHVLSETYDDGQVSLDVRIPNGEMARIEALGGRVVPMDG